MNNKNPQSSSKHGGFISKNPILLVTGLLLVTGFFMGSALSVFSSNASADDAAAQSTRSPLFQKRLDAEKAADEQRDHAYALQEQSRLEELEIKRLRAERATQRNAAAAAAKQQKASEAAK